MASESEWLTRRPSWSRGWYMQLQTPRLRCLLLLIGFLSVGGLYLHAYGHLQWNVDRTYQYINSHLHLQVKRAPCNATCRWLREQQRRKELVASTCSYYRNSSTADLSYTLTSDLLRTMTHLLVLDSHKLIYCYVPKVGCTNWKRIFLVLSGVMEHTNMTSQYQTHMSAKKHIRTLAEYSLAEAKRRLASYTKFMFARHPFKRLLSGYRDKFLMDYPSSTAFRKNYGPKISSYGDTGRGRPALRSDGTLNVSFAQFARYIADPANEFRSNDPTEHWNQMYRMCHPCAVNYDIFGNFSTLHQDADFLLHLQGLDRKVSYPKSTNPTNSSDEQYLARYFANLLPADIEALLARYSVDFEVFGYTVPSSVQNNALRTT